MATKTRKKKAKKIYTAEEIAEFRARDAAIIEAADQAMVRPDAGARAAAVVLSDGFRRITTYSLYNQISLMEQADKLGMPLTDVDTFAGWCQRGRVVRQGERAQLYIARPVGVEEVEESGEAIILDGDQREDDAEAKPRFRMDRRFELSQTTELSDADRVEAGEAFEANHSPAAVAWFERLTRDAEQIGYTVRTVTAGVAGVCTDDTERVITVTVAAEGQDEASTREQLADLAQVIAHRIGDARTNRKAKKTEAAETAPVLQMA